MVVLICLVWHRLVLRIQKQEKNELKKILLLVLMSAVCQENGKNRIRSPFIRIIKILFQEMLSVSAKLS